MRSTMSDFEKVFNMQKENRGRARPRATKHWWTFKIWIRSQIEKMWPYYDRQNILRVPSHSATRITDGYVLIHCKILKHSPPNSITDLAHHHLENCEKIMTNIKLLDVNGHENSNVYFWKRKRRDKWILSYFIIIYVINWESLELTYEVWIEVIFKVSWVEVSQSWDVNFCFLNCRSTKITVKDYLIKKEKAKLLLIYLFCL